MRLDMVFHKLKQSIGSLRLGMRVSLSVTMLFLLIELFDELAFAVEGVAIPLIRTDLGLSYSEIGILLAAGAVAVGVVEPVLMVLGDTRWRRALILGGGLALAAAFGLVAVASGLPPLLVAFAIGSPASGAFVILSQATLMDLNPGRQSHAMARWSVAGSLGSLAGPILFAGVLLLGGTWRIAFAAFGFATLVLVGLLYRRRLQAPGDGHPQAEGGAQLMKGLWQAITDPALLRWIALLEFSDLMLDMLASYVPLYFTDVVGISAAHASLVAALFMLAGLVSDIITVPLLERIPGRRLVRLSAAAVLLLYPIWLILPGLGAKLVLLALLGILRMGWYAVLQGEAYATRPERSGTVMAVTSLAALVAGAMAVGMGYAAEQLGLDEAMWLLIIGPMALVLFVPRARPPTA